VPRNLVPGVAGLLPGVLCAVLLVGASVAPASAKSRSCVKDGDHVVVRTRDVVVVRRGKADDPRRRFVSCWRATGRRVLLGKFAGGDQPPKLIRVRDGWVAYATDWCTDGRYEYPIQCEPIVEWVRARDAHNRFNFLDVDTISRLELCANRDVILLGTTASGARKAVKVSYRSARLHTLAEDASLDLRSLRRRDGRATWSVASGRHGSVACA
jgi:hypothetical protein